jgi:hypothetical protein
MVGYLGVYWIGRFRDSSLYVCRQEERGLQCIKCIQLDVLVNVML